MNSSVKVTSHRWENLPVDILNLRKQVFINEQHVPIELEFDEMDETSIHFGAYQDSSISADGPVSGKKAVPEVVGCARLYRSGKREDQGVIGRMAVDSSCRNQGIAFHLINEVIRYGVENLGFTSFKLSAQLTAIDFYRRSGFIPYGDQFIDAGIDHMDMFHMAPAIWLHSRVKSDATTKQPFCTGKDDSTWLFSTLEECQALARTLLLQAKNKIDIYSHDLEHELYDEAQIVDYISSVARAHPASEVRILITNEQTIVKRHHHLVSLAERIPSKISLKICDSTYPNQTSSFLIADRYMVLYREDRQLFEGFVNFKAAGRVKALRDDFDAMWQHAKESKEFGTFGL